MKHGCLCDLDSVLNGSVWSLLVYDLSKKLDQNVLQSAGIYQL